MSEAFDLKLLDSLSRDELIEQARKLGAKRPELMTRVELRDEIIRLSEPDAALQKKTRGWLGVARDLVASVVESGLNMRDAAALIRGEQRAEQAFHGPPPVATVTLAEIYVAQGHPERALSVLDEVLEREPDHESARALRDRLQREGGNRRRARVVEAAPETPRPQEPPEAESIPEPPATPRTPLPVAPSAAPPSSEPREAPLAEPVAEPACVLVQQGVMWVARWQVEGEAEPLSLRVLCVMPHKPAPTQIVRDVVLETAAGSCEIAGLPVGGVVRGALGRLSAGGFAPLAVAVVIGDTAGGRSALYRPPAHQPTPLEQALLAV